MVDVRRMLNEMEPFRREDVRGQDYVDEVYVEILQLREHIRRVRDKYLGPMVINRRYYN